MGNAFCSKKKQQTVLSKDHKSRPNKPKESKYSNNPPTLSREDSFDIDPDYLHHNNHNNQHNHISNMSSSKKRKLNQDDDTSDSEPAKKKQKTTTNKKDGIMTKKAFLKYAKNQIAVCGEMKWAVKKKENSTGSVGFHAAHHGIIKLDKDKKVAVMVSLNATVIGSKKWEDGDDLSDDEDEDEDDDLEHQKDAKEKGDTMTKSEFLSIAKDLTLKLFDQEFTLKPKKAKSGSVGWQLNGLKIKTEINEIPLRLQTSVNMTCKKSKDWSEGEEDEDDDKDEKSKK